MLHDFGWPLIKTLYDKYKERGLKVVYFNNDDDEVRWKSHVEKNQLTWINVSEKQKFLERDRKSVV